MLQPHDDILSQACVIGDFIPHKILHGKMGVKIWQVKINCDTGLSLQSVDINDFTFTNQRMIIPLPSSLPISLLRTATL